MGSKLNIKNSLYLVFIWTLNYGAILSYFLVGYLSANIIYDARSRLKSSDCFVCMGRGKVSSTLFMLYEENGGGWEVLKVLNYRVFKLITFTPLLKTTPTKNSPKISLHRSKTFPLIIQTIFSLKFFKKVMWKRKLLKKCNDEKETMNKKNLCLVSRKS